MVLNRKRRKLAIHIGDVSILDKSNASNSQAVIYRYLTIIKFQVEYMNQENCYLIYKVCKDLFDLMVP